MPKNPPVAKGLEINERLSKFGIPIAGGLSANYQLLKKAKERGLAGATWNRDY